MRIIAIINQKGGCGKTTTAINLTGMFARRGCRSLLIDMDPQSHCAAGLAIPDDRIDTDVGEALVNVHDGPLDVGRLVWRVSRRFDLIPSRTGLAGLEASRGGLAGATDRDRRLGQVIRTVERAQREQLAEASDEPFEGPGYDVVCIDCPPSIGLLTYNALAAATEVLVPVETSFFALQGARKQVRAIQSLGKRLGLSPKVRLVATMHDENSALASDVFGELKTRYEQAVLPFAIRFDSALREAASFGRPVGEYAPQSPGASDYDRLAEWLMTHDGVRASELPLDEWEQTEGAPVASIDELNARAREAGGLPPRDAGAQAEPPATPIESDRTEPGVISPLEDERSAVPVTVVRGSLEQTGWAPSDVRDAGPRQADTAGRDGEPATIEPAEGRGGTRAQDVIRRAQLLQRQRLVAASGVRPRTADAVPATSPNGVELAPAADPVDAPPESLRRLFGVTAVQRGLAFVLPASIGRDVFVAGSFNNWSHGAHRLRLNRSLGVFELSIAVEPGEHEYRYVIDDRWTIDPFNPNRRPNSFGDTNSVVRYEGT